MRLRNKILLLAVLPTALVLALVAVVALHAMRERLLETTQEWVRREVETAARVIDQDNREAVTTAQIMASSQRNGLFGQRDSSSRMAREILEANPQYIGAYFGYEPDADGTDAAELERLGASNPLIDDTGRFLPYWFRTPDDEITVEPLVDMESSLYYGGMQQLWRESGDEARYIITEPYVYNDLNLIIEQTSPIVIDGRFVGIAGVDRGLDFLEAFLRRLKPFESANLTLISGRGRIIATTLGDVFKADLRTVHIDDLFTHEDGRIATDLLIERDGKRVLDPDRQSEVEELDRDIQERLRAFVASADTNAIQDFETQRTGRRLLGTSARIQTGDWVLILTMGWDEITAPMRSTLTQVLAIAAIGILLVILILVMLANRLSRRLGDVAQTARRVADGDLTSRVVVDAGDEMGALQGAIQDMVSGLNRLIGQVQLSSVRLRSTATEIAASSREQQRAVQEFNAATQQAGAASREIHGTSRELSQTMEELAETAGETERLADGGRARLGEMAGAMERLSASTGSVSASLGEIAQRAADITELVTTITTVADQTNLLSVNAAIEAEKAGVHGRGFSVVAREIRRLADQTAQATLDIERIVGVMQQAVDDGVREMEQFSTEVQERSQEVTGIGRQIEEVITRVAGLTSSFEEVNEGMRSQSEGAAQISEAMGGLAKGVSQTVSSLHEFREASENLEAAVADLRGEVERFQTVEGDGEGS